MRPDVLIRLEIGQRAVGHVLREAFFEPEIVKPFHGGEIAEPLMGEFVKEESIAPEPVVFGRSAAEQDAVFVEERGTGVLHAAERKAGDEHHVVLRKRKRLGEIVGEEFDTVGGDLLDSGNLRLRADELRVADVHVREIVNVVDPFEGSDGESEEISADGCRFGELVAHRPRGRHHADPGVRNHRATRGRVDVQSKPPFQIGLIKTRKRRTGIHRNKQRIEIFAAVVLVFVASDGLTRRPNWRVEFEAKDDLTAMKGR